MGDAVAEGKRVRRPSKRSLERYEGMKIPDYILESENPPAEGGAATPPKTPIIAFVNSKSGGQLGSAIIKSFREILNPKQVYDLADEKPEEVLIRLLGHLEKLKEEGDETATHVRTHLRMIVAGGDGTAGWLLGVMGDMKLEHPPPIATMPLGTGNNLPYSFGWGKKNPGTDVRSVRKFLKEVSKANPIKVDSWHVTMKMAVENENNSMEPVKVPHSLHSFHRIVDTEHEDGRVTFRGGFWNYFSIGMDAEVAYAFHSERQNHPEKFKNQFTNQSQYAKLTCAQGWFCASCFHPASRNINQLAKIKIAKKGEAWQELEISRSIRAIVVLNLPSFSGGLNPWGTPSDKKSKKRGLTAPFVDDGLLEVVGFKDAWHGTVLFTPNGHGVRLAQTHRLRVEFHSGAATETYMRMDGEPWLQPLPNAPKPTVLEITQLGQSLVLATRKSIVRADSRAPLMQPGDEVGVKNHDGVDWNEDQMATGPRSSSSSSSSSSSDDDPALKHKFGAASTFKRSDVQ
ncbi:hypothetical protein M758_1G042400 [Ceratodon purpureus]|nr:hypothetical protein M758_1G042400 [Ceratodon purpureus]